MTHYRLDLPGQLSRRNTLQIAGAVGALAIASSSGAAQSAAHRSTRATAALPPAESPASTTRRGRRRSRRVGGGGWCHGSVSTAHRAVQ